MILYDNIINMPRVKLAQPQIKEEIAQRFAMAFEVGMGLSPAEISRKLGYANQTTIHSIKRGKSLPDFARIALYRHELRDRKGYVLNLHWLITGDGKPFIRANNAEVNSLGVNFSKIDNDIIMLISQMNSRKKSALTKLLIEMS